MMRNALFRVVTVLVCLLAGCGANSASPQGGSAAQPSVQLATLPAATKPAAAQAAPTVVSALAAPEEAPFEFLKKATLTQLQAKSFRGTTNTTRADGTTTTTVIEYVSPDRIHLVLNRGSEEIAIKGKGVWTNSSGTWTQMGSQLSDAIFAAIEPPALEDMLKQVDVSSVQFGGNEQLNGKPVFVYTYDTNAQVGGQTIHSHNKVWIGTADQRVYKLDVTSDSLTAPGQQDHIVITYEYDIPLSIEPPA